MRREPDMQVFRQSGTWHRPEGATKVKVLAKAGDAGGSVEADGTIVPGVQGEVVVKEMSAKEAGPEVPIKIGEAVKVHGWEIARPLMVCPVTLLSPPSLSVLKCSLACVSSVRELSDRSIPSGSE